MEEQLLSVQSPAACGGGPPGGKRGRPTGSPFRFSIFIDVILNALHDHLQRHQIVPAL